MPFVDDRLEEAQEKRQQQVADVQAVDVGIGGEDDLVVAQALGRVLDVQAAHQVVQLLVLVHHIALQVADVQRLAAQGEDRLVVHVAAADDRTGGGLAFGDEDHRVGAAAGALVEVDLAVLELRHADGGGARALAGHLLDGLQLLAQLDGFLDLDQGLFRRLGIAVEQVGDDLPHLRRPARRAVRCCRACSWSAIRRPAPAAGSAMAPAIPSRMSSPSNFPLENSLNPLTRPSRNALRCDAAVAGVLAVDEGQEGLFETLRVGEGQFQRLGTVVQRRVQRFVADLVAQQVEQAVAGKENLAVVFDAQSGVQERIEPQAAVHVIRCRRPRRRRSPDPVRS